MKWIIWLLILLILAGGLLACVPLLCHEFRHTTVKEHAFYITSDFEHVRKIMVRTDASERLLAACGGEIVEKHVDSLNFSTDRLINGNFTLACQARLLLKMPDPQSGGYMFLPVTQTAHVRPQELLSTIKLVHPVGNIHDQQIVLHMQPYGKMTLVRMRAVLEVRVHAPVWLKLEPVLKSRMEAGLNEATKKMQDTLIQVTEEYRGKKLFLKLQ